ncbi:hypothetical protein [Fibrobacter sp. UWB13]|uniref:hypothetical protein n=1 Tax=Fibrobacter sp. UWB13 TaxID=1896204 RepID=UPI001594AAF0|nr:hypothetical protein [Fibrobacter sp. UWB13]
MNENALSENSSFHGYDYHSFNNQEDLWKFLADVRSKEESSKRNKICSGLIRKPDENTF